MCSGEGFSVRYNVQCWGRSAEDEVEEKLSRVRLTAVGGRNVKHFFLAGSEKKLVPPALLRQIKYQTPFYHSLRLG